MLNLWEKVDELQHPCPNRSVCFVYEKLPNDMKGSIFNLASYSTSKLCYSSISQCNYGFPCYQCNCFCYGDIQVWLRKECFGSDVDTNICFPLMRIVIVPEPPIMSRLAFHHIIRIEQVNTDRECCNSSPVRQPADHNWPYEPTWPMQDS